ncbi:unnamed protein product [Protopolystoma xenopodis]|uniref:Uncharacterized protein n=1 Tax=Protopolystoma xenopodis TaxID=117903 RepID=A0A3S5CQJ7_9PLAT|nr:unnamed protein product [Protopolystoma xenopodis]
MFRSRRLQEYLRGGIVGTFFASIFPSYAINLANIEAGEPLPSLSQGSAFPEVNGVHRGGDEHEHIDLTQAISIPARPTPETASSSGAVPSSHSFEGVLPFYNLV